MSGNVASLLRVPSSVRVSAEFRNLTTAQGVCLLVLLRDSKSAATELPETLGEQIRQTCVDCHDGASSDGDLDLMSPVFELDDRPLCDRWILIRNRVKLGEMPHDPMSLSDRDRQALVAILHDYIAKADREDVLANGPKTAAGDKHGLHRAFRRDHNQPRCNRFVTMLQNIDIETNRLSRRQP